MRRSELRGIPGYQLSSPVLTLPVVLFIQIMQSKHKHDVASVAIFGHRVWRYWEVVLPVVLLIWLVKVFLLYADLQTTVSS